MFPVTITLHNPAQLNAVMAALAAAPASATLVPAANPVAGNAQPDPKPAKPAKPAKAEDKAAPQASGPGPSTSSSETSAPPPAEAPAPAPAAPTVDYPTLQKAVFALANADRPAAAAVVASFNVKTFKDLAQDQWPAALAAVEAKLKELQA